MAFIVLRINAETVTLLAFAAAVMRLISSGAKRTGTIRPFISVFGSLGRPRPRFFGSGWFNVVTLSLNRPKLLNDGRSDSIHRRFNRA